MLKVTEVVSSKDKELPRKNAPGTDTFVSYRLNVEEGSNLHKNVELFIKKDAPPPVAGQEITDRYLNRKTIQTANGPREVLELKRNASIGGGGGGGFRPRDPKESARIVRQHSQEMALRYAAIKASLGQLPKDFKPGDLKAIIDFFQLDVDEAPQKYGVERVKEPVRTGVSDVPDAKPGEFVEPKPDSLEGTPWAVSTPTT